MNTILLLFVVVLLLKAVVEIGLEQINKKYVLAHKGKVPSVYKEVMKQKTYDKSIEYTLAKGKFEQWETVYDTMILGTIVLSGFLPWLYGGISTLVGWFFWDQALVLILMGFVLAIPMLPLEWWHRFRLEAHFGFNRMNLKTWIMDKLMVMTLVLFIGLPILWVLLAFYRLLPDTWWLWSFGVVFVLQLLILVLYPRLILPLFNKLKPLEQGKLRERLMKLAKQSGFEASAIEVMDGSKRSTHSNAFFTGFGKFRHIILYDTLIEQLEPVELEAVLVHEIGHYKKGHVPKRMVLSGVIMFVCFAAMGWLVKQGWFYESFGFSGDEGIIPALLLFSLLGGLATFWFQPLLNLWSRRHEYEADRFARDALKTGKPLIISLRKLHEKNLSNLTPHPLFSCFYYSHPTLVEREEALEKK